jgi:hypothetical protein
MEGLGCREPSGHRLERQSLDNIRRVASFIHLWDGTEYIREVTNLSPAHAVDQTTRRNYLDNLPIQVPWQTVDSAQQAVGYKYRFYTWTETSQIHNLVGCRYIAWRY